MSTYTYITVVDMTYLRSWRKRKAEVNAIAQLDSDDNLDIHSLPSDRSDGDGLQEVVQDNESDYGYTEHVESSDSEPEILSLHPDSDTPDIGCDLRTWSTSNSITQMSLNELLGILRRHGHQLPKDARTLLSTPKTVECLSRCNGQYIYYGLEQGIKLKIAQCQSFSQNLVELCVNIDGVPLFKSNSVQFWPILAQFHNFDPFIVALFCGTAKPSPLDDFVKDLLEEFQHLKAVGMEYEGQLYAISLTAFICDAPARSFLKCIKNHNGYSSCERCLAKGSWEGRVVFNSHESFRARTDEEFSQVLYEDHQTIKSPLIDAGIPCVSTFVLDYMHLICLGVVKRVLVFLSRGPKVCRLSARQKDEISEKLNKLNGSMPSEFARQPRGLRELDRWKATEFRQFVLYTGPNVLRNVVSREVYTHFLTLTVALSILLSSDENTRRSYIAYAEELLKYFVKRCDDLYGKTFAVYNVHCLLHLHEDASRFNCSLNDISCFPFENHLQVIKKLVKNSHNPIAQVTKRMSEIENAKKGINKPQEPRSCFYISTKDKDHCFMLHNENFAFVKEKRQDGTLVCDVLSQKDTRDFFKKPCESRLLNIVYVQRKRTKTKLLQTKDLYRKVACLPCEQGHVLFPLLHGMEHRK